MSELQLIEVTLRKAARRRRLASALRGAWKGLLAGSIAALVLLVAYKLLPLPLWVPLLVIALPTASMLAGFVAGGWRRPSLSETARYVDLKESLKERLSTALEVSSKSGANKWRDLVVTDAASHAKDLDPRRIVPFTLSRASRWSLCVLILVAGLGFVPEYRAKSYLQKQTDQLNIQQVGKQLTELTRRNLDKRPPVLEPTQKAMASVTELGERLTKASLTRAEALKDIANVAEKLKEQANQLTQDPVLKRLEQASRAPGGGQRETPAEVRRQMEALQKQLGTPTGHPDGLEKVRDALEKLRKQVAAQAQAEGGIGESDKQKISAALSALSRQMQDMGLQAPEIEAAMEALAANQTDMLLKDLQASVNDLEKMRDMAKTLQQLQQQMDKMGKDLAEQLKLGQPEVAEQTLREMIQKLQASNIPPEQMAKMMSDVAQAVSPAANYGKVAEHLNQAAANMKASAQSAAAQDLAKAADELQKLMQNMGDAQSLMAELQALNEASMCIANGTCWKPGGKPKASQGGGVGAGVGTWASDESREWNGPVADRWDNSGVFRPDMDARGVSDRDPTLNEALKPTKVKGQFSPGNQMPSVTLKGISIRGQSTVDYEAAASAAQSDAESALSQDKVPRAYQGAVKDYFDDLK